MNHSTSVHGIRLRFVLASTSPARLALLRAAGLKPEPSAPGIVEDVFVARIERERGASLPVAELVQLLAKAKAEAVATALQGSIDEPTLVFGGDSAFEFDGRIYGKPHTAERARERWLQQSGRTGTLWSGHWLIRVDPAGPVHSAGRVAAATVTFAEVSETEIDAYIATGEPLKVAGAFTIDSLGAPFITHVDGDPSTVVGLSLSTLRELVRELGVEWTELWRPRSVLR